MILYHVHSGLAKIKTYAKSPKQAAYSILEMDDIGPFVVVSENEIVEENGEEDIYFSTNSLVENNSMRIVY